MRLQHAKQVAEALPAGDPSEPVRKLRRALRAVDRYLRSQGAWLGPSPGPQWAETA